MHKSSKLFVLAILSITTPYTASADSSSNSPDMSQDYSIDQSGGNRYDHGYTEDRIRNDHQTGQQTYPSGIKANDQTTDRSKAKINSFPTTNSNRSREF